MTKFIVHKDSVLYTSHGDMQAFLLYDAYQRGEITKSFKIAGFKPRGEETGSIISIKEISVPVGNELYISGEGLQSNKVIMYPGQKLMDFQGNFVNIDNIEPDTHALSFNGLVRIENISVTDNEELKTYYILEVDDKLNTLFVSNMILFSWEDSHQENPFLEEN